MCGVGSALTGAMALPLALPLITGRSTEATRNDSLAEAKTSVIVTGRLPPVRAETRGDAAPSVHFLVVPAAALGGRRAHGLVLRPLEPLDVLAALVLMSQTVSYTHLTLPTICSV